MADNIIQMPTPQNGCCANHSEQRGEASGEHAHGGCCANHEHSHNHEHGHGGGCCGKHKKLPSIETLSEAETIFLENLIHHRYFPVAQYVLKSSREPDFESIMLTPVFLQTLGDSIEKIREVGATLKKLEKDGFITIDFEIPLKNYEYKEYYEAEAHSIFTRTVEQGKMREDFLGDTAVVEAGSIAPTDRCLAAFGAHQ